MKKTLILGFTLVLGGVSVMIASAGFKKRDFTGNAIVQICAKDEAGKWQIVDEMNAPLRFVFNIADVAQDKDVSSDFTFSGRSRKGLTISARLKKGATGNSDLSTGLVTLNLPLDISIDGKITDTVFKFTTESTEGAIGSITGRRARIDQNARTAQLAMVSSAIVPNTDLITVNQEEPNADEKVNEKKELKKEELLIIVYGDGILKSLQ